ncbi:hypothetical protein EDD17DRAFT_1531499 [Pisolithus thermaeus]|nr:hypothetical protein EDD17DRAFT_1531499 [Pisolithus thermaeus]
MVWLATLCISLLPSKIHLIYVLVPPWLLLTRRLPRSVRGVDFETCLVLLLPTSLPCLYVRTSHLFTPLWLFPPCLPWLSSSANQGCRRDLPQEAMAGRGILLRRYIWVVVFVARQTEVQSMDCQTSPRQLPAVHDPGCMMFIPR